MLVVQVRAVGSLEIRKAVGLRAGACALPLKQSARQSAEKNRPNHSHGPTATNADARFRLPGPRTLSPSNRHAFLASRKQEKKKHKPAVLVPPPHHQHLHRPSSGSNFRRAYRQQPVIRPNQPAAMAQQPSRTTACCAVLCCVVMCCVQMTSI